MTVNLILKGIPAYDPMMEYEHGDLFYCPELDSVYMEDKYHERNMQVLGEIRYDAPQVKYDIRIPSRGTGKGAIITESMPYGWNKIKKVVFNDPATIVFWQDDTKTVVKCAEGESYDPEKGMMAAITKKAFGNLGNYYNQIKKWLPEDTKVEKSEDDKNVDGSSSD